jgi:N utilization substance protein A
MIPNALQPAQIDEIFLYQRLGRAIVLVKEDQLSLAIGRRGQNVRLASKLVGWDIEIMTLEELTEGIERAETWFKAVPNVTDGMVERLIEEGFLSFDDLTCIDAAELSEITELSEEDADDVIIYAEEMAEKLEQEAEARKAAGEEPTTRGGAGQQRVQLTPAQQLFGDDGATQQEEPKPTLETLFADAQPGRDGEPAQGSGGTPSAEAPVGEAQSAEPQTAEMPSAEMPSAEAADEMSSGEAPAGDVSADVAVAQDAGTPESNERTDDADVPVVANAPEQPSPGSAVPDEAGQPS